jgi:hypothetical protein
MGTQQQQNGEKTGHKDDDPQEPVFLHFLHHG